MIIKELASYQSTVKHIAANWPAFLDKRGQRLAQQRYGTASEKVAENILEDLLTMVIGWPLSNINNQVGYADLVVTNLSIKQLIIEAKRPASLAWNRDAIESALDQAIRHADEQRVKCVGISDGYMLYAADIKNGGLYDRVFVQLDSGTPDESLWWLSEHGIYRPRIEVEGASLRLLPEAEDHRTLPAATDNGGHS